MASLDFKTDAKNAEDDDELIELNISDSTGRNTETYLVYSPTETQIALYLASYGEGNLQLLAATKEFLYLMFGDEAKSDADFLLARLKDRHDAFEIGTLTHIILGLIEASTGRPTRPSTGSTQSQRPGGRRLMDKQLPKAQTRSRSVPAASTTSSTPGRLPD